MSNLDWALVIITLVGVLGATALALMGIALSLSSGSGGLAQDILHTTYQFLLVAVVGGGVSWLYREYVRNREREESQHKQRADLYSDLVTDYNRVKCIRRLLRARGRRDLADKSQDEDEVMIISVYDELMRELIDVQLKFEAYRRLVRGPNPLFQKIDSLECSLRSIEEYLGGVAKEYETALRLREPKQDLDHVLLKNEKVKRLSEFIAKRKPCSDIERQLFKPFNRVLEALSERDSKGGDKPECGTAYVADRENPTA